MRSSECDNVTATAGHKWQEATQLRHLDKIIQTIFSDTAPHSNKNSQQAVQNQLFSSELRPGGEACHLMFQFIISKYSNGLSLSYFIFQIFNFTDLKDSVVLN